ncbi:hypothetical protein [Streptomyces sp. NPDC085596]|uniref:hypothetical protein n=1 Tax=Streptomyces sp. NPDC085596 TaxID=3365731 RepID=UPI0037D48EBC
MSGIGGSSSSDPYDSDPYGDSSSSDAYDLGASTGDSDGGTYRSRPARRSTPTASSSGGTAQTLKDGTAVLIRCASTDDPYATVEVRNPNGREGLFTVRISFRDEHGLTVIDSSDQVSVSAKDEATVRVPVASTGRVDEIDHCEVDPRATADQ